MPRLLIHVEGQTEETFDQNVLRDHLVQAGYGSVSARLVGNPRLRSRRGGIRSWQSTRNDILRHLKQDAGAVASTLLDYYGMPHDSPGRGDAQEKRSTSEKAQCVETALFEDVWRELGERFDPRGFVPLVMMHEFEALLFSDPDRFAHGIGKGELAREIQAIRREFESPEDINDSTETAPSKRIIRLFPEYEKPLFGVIAAIEIGLHSMRLQCPHFNTWLERLEALPTECSYLP
jgi:hypothetical protein